ncbi:MAG: anhydro-N-acetylmuramic acid kinase [Gemmatimonadota bacterium]
MATLSQGFLVVPDDPTLVIGLMSGTSADGVDAAACRLRRPSEGDRLEWEVLGTAFRSYPRELAERLRRPDHLVALDIAAFDFEIGERFAEAAREVARAAGIPLAEFCLIGSHGQTVWHDPRGELGGHPATLQIGESAVIAERTGLAVWSDFRTADVAAGGEGAPLVPYVDRLLFAREDGWAVCLNLGGIANVTLLPPGAGPDDVIAFDTGPANMVLDALAERLLGERRDEGGRRAAAGRPDEARVREALADPYFARPAPKSTGREHFGLAWLERHFGPLEDLSEQDVGERMASAALVTVESVARAIEGASGTPAVPAGAEVIVAGGGRRNRALMEGLGRRLAPRAVVPVDARGLDGDFKEAVAFAVLAYESALGRPVNLPSVTGARHPARCGKLAFPPPGHPRGTL